MMKAKNILLDLAAAGILLAGPSHFRPSVPAGTPGAEKTIAVLGSSVAAGWVTSRDAKHDMANGYAQRLGRLLGPRGFKVVNVSVPGDTTEKVLARLDKDLFPIKPDFVLIALSLENEGIQGYRSRVHDPRQDGRERGRLELRSRRPDGHQAPQFLFRRPCPGDPVAPLAHERLPHPSLDRAEQRSGGEKPQEDGPDSFRMASHGMTSTDSVTTSLARTIADRKRESIRGRWSL